MSSNRQLNLLEYGELGVRTDDWTFNGASTRELTHCYHDYPARMIPQIAGKLLDLYGKKAKLLFDPYCGTGTSLVESLIRGINAVGTDLNPLACLIANAKVARLDIKRVDQLLSKYNRFILKPHVSASSIPTAISGISRLGFWFKPAVLEKLAEVKTFIDGIEEKGPRLFFEVAFSETVRECSNTRTGEFKLYRYDDEKLKTFNPDVFGTLANKLDRNKRGLRKLLEQLNQLSVLPTAKVYSFNTVEGIPTDMISQGSVEIVITSPPYGDSHTTVAYGQYSRLSAAWLGLPDPEKIDQKLMGGKITRSLPLFGVEPLDKSLKDIHKLDDSRAREIASFYADLEKSISNVATIIRRNGYACYVVGNRKVKGTVLPTDLAIRHFFEKCGFDYITTHKRTIPNKRMPLKNSPSNLPGSTDSTMTREFIVIMRKR